MKERGYKIISGVGDAVLHKFKVDDKKCNPLRKKCLRVDIKGVQYLPIIFRSKYDSALNNIDSYSQVE